MSTLDHDKDGKISFDEFKEGFEVTTLLLSESMTEHCFFLLQSYSHDFLVAHGAHLSDQDDESEPEGGGVGGEEELLQTKGPMMSTPVVVSGSREEDVWESGSVPGRGKGEEEEGEGGERWLAMAERIDPDNLLRG